MSTSPSPIRCMNCNEPIASNSMKLFAEVCVCVNCYDVATRLQERAVKELKVLLAMTKDAIRLALIQKKLQFKTPEELRSVSKVDLLSKLASLVQQAQMRAIVEEPDEPFNPPV